MDPVTAKLMSAAGAAADPVYVDDVFSTFLYDGTGSAQTITNGIDLSGEGGLVWAKSRSSRNHILSDTERGTGKVLFSNSTSAQDADATTITSYNSNGFTMGGSALKMNTSGEKFCSWTFRKAPRFFDVVTYTGNGTAGRTVSHNLGSVPGSIWVKCTTANHSWAVYHREVPNTKFLLLNDPDGASAGSQVAYWNNTTPTSSVFTVGTQNRVNGLDDNGNGETYVAYVFAHDEQSFGDDLDEAVIKCGSYTGNGTSSSSINTITLGFEPQWVMIKRTSSSGDWVMLDTMRGFTAAGLDDEYLLANSSGAAGSFSQASPTPTGFQLQGNSGDTNGDAATFVYIAIRRPHKPPSAGTEVFDAEYRMSSGAGTTFFTTGFASDLILYTKPSASSNRYLSSRLTSGANFLSSNLSDAEYNDGQNVKFDDSTGKISLTGLSGSTDYIFYNFKRALGFFDVVTYTGTGSTKTESHNLGVVPEMMWVKRRSGSVNWAVYYGDNTDYLVLNSNSHSTDNNELWNDTSPTASVFTVGPDNDVNYNTLSYIAYLFATLPGISKIGTFTGTGNDLSVDCGFTNGARFVMIKRTNSSGDWYVYDTLRGIVSGNDPYVLLNNTAAQVTNTDYIDPLGAGFTVTSSAPAALNASGGTYLFLAIA